MKASDYVNRFVMSKKKRANGKPVHRRASFHKNRSVSRRMWRKSLNSAFCSWSVASSWSLNEAAGFRECRSFFFLLHSTCCYAKFRKQLKTHSTAHTGGWTKSQIKNKKNKKKTQKRILLVVHFNTTQHSRCKNDDWPHTALEMLHRNGVKPYIHNAGWGRNWLYYVPIVTRERAAVCCKFK